MESERLTVVNPESHSSLILKSRLCPWYWWGWYSLKSQEFNPL